jgi:hypothetical protein
MRLHTRLLAAALLLLAGAPQPAPAQDSVVFDGERYARVHRERQSDGNRMAQFVREPETLENWTQSLGFYRYTTIGNDPARAAAELRDSVKAANPDAQAGMIVHPVTRDATVDFLARPRDGRYLEFNVMRYAMDAGGKGLVAFRFAHRFHGATKELPEEFNKSRLSWRSQVVEFELAQIHAALAD